MPEPARPTPGDVLWIGREASVQFAVHPFAFLLLRVHTWSTYTGWIWLDGVQLDRDGTVIQRRSIFVQTLGLRPAPAGQPRPDPARFMEQVARECREPDSPRRTR